VSRSSDDIESSGDGVRVLVLVLRAGRGSRGTGGTGVRTRVVDVRDTADVVRCLVGPDVVAPRAAAVSVRREDTDVVGGEDGRRGTVDSAACFVRWRGAGGLGLETLFGADVVRARGVVRVVVAFVSVTFVLRVDPDTVR
jgi:hypothetical protein